jgi:hypothetical protein
VRRKVLCQNPSGGQCRDGMTAVSAGLFGWLSLAILYSYEETGRRAAMTFQEAETVYLVVHPPLAGILASLLCAATSFAYLVAAAALLRRASWPGPLIIFAAAPGTIGALFSCALEAAAAKLAGFLSELLILSGLLALAFTWFSVSGVRRAEVTAWLAKSQPRAH